MNWRVMLAVLAGLLLILPLMALLSALMKPAAPEVGPRGRPLSPLLDTESRTQLITYRRDCTLSSDCEPPLGCLTDARLRAHYCTDSQCLTDAQCPSGHACRRLATTGDGPLVRFCVPIGRRKEGERCIKVPDDQDSACAAELMCGGQLGWCARPCHENAAACPQGFFCADTEPEPVCLPTCEVQGCPVGQQCIHHEEGASACAQVYGLQCQQSPCPAGRKCEVRHATAHPGKVWMECVERCGEEFPSCAAGMICDGWQCQRSCSPQEQNPCSEGYRCGQRRPGEPHTCQPDW
jgi:hypothetical protein